MSTAISPSPRRVAAGRVNAQKRWGAVRIIRLDNLTPEQRHLILALVAAARSAHEEAATEVAPVTAGDEEQTIAPAAS